MRALKEFHKKNNDIEAIKEYWQPENALSGWYLELES